MVIREMDVHVRLNFFEAGLLYELAEKEKLNRSEVIRDLIRTEAVRAGIIEVVRKSSEALNE